MKNTLSSGFLSALPLAAAAAVDQIQEVGGRLVMAGATKDSVKAMPAFAYATDATRRDRFMAAAEKDIASGKAKVADLEMKAGAAAPDVRVGIVTHIDGFQANMATANARFGEMKAAGETRWKGFKADVNAAIARLRKSIVTAEG
jgi:hypothetical protein